MPLAAQQPHTLLAALDRAGSLDDVEQVMIEMARRVHESVPDSGHRQDQTHSAA